MGQSTAEISRLTTEESVSILIERLVGGAAGLCKKRVHMELQGAQNSATITQDYVLIGH